MKKVLYFSILLVVGLIGSQTLPLVIGEGYGIFAEIVSVLTMIALSFIMIHVGYEFDIDKTRLKSYGWDYVVAMTAAAFPWIFVTLYFLLFMLPEGSFTSFNAWKETLLAGRFAAPTSAGVLFSMLAAAGLSATWLFKKARVLAIFDDLDTVLLMIPLKMLMVGLVLQLGIIVIIMAVMLYIAWRYLHSVALPITWKWVLFYSVVIVGISELIYYSSYSINSDVPIHIEVLLPAFVLGAIMKYPEGADPHVNDCCEGHQEGPEDPEEQKISTIVSAVFMVLVGLNMPQITTQANLSSATSILSSLDFPGWGMIIFHVIMITIVSNIGKMFPVFCYRKEAHWKERLAVSIGMWPRGEVGAGVLIVSLGYGIGGPVITVAVLSLALNLVLTGVFIVLVKNLLSQVKK